MEGVFSKNHCTANLAMGETCRSSRCLQPQSPGKSDSEGHCFDEELSLYAEAGNEEMKRLGNGVEEGEDHAP